MSCFQNIFLSVYQIRRIVELRAMRRYGPAGDGESDMKDTFKKYHEALRAKSVELARSLRHRDEIAIENSAESLEMVTLAAQRDLAVKSLDHNTQLSREVGAALERLSSGTFGVCEQCECEIPEKRLGAVPWTRYCVQCQEAVENVRPSHASFFRLAA